MEMYEQKKHKREWIDTGNASTNAEAIYRKLSNELISKYIDKGTWIRRIEQDYFYAGDKTKVTVTYDNGYRTVYVIDK